MVEVVYFGIKSSSPSYRSPATRPPHPPAQQHGCDLERSFVQRRNLERYARCWKAGEGKHLGDFNEAVHPSNLTNAQILRTGVSQKKTAKTLKNLQNFHISSPFSSLFNHCGWPIYPSSTLPPYHIRKFLSLDRFHIRQLRGHDDLTASHLRTRSQVW